MFLHLTKCKEGCTKPSCQCECHFFAKMKSRYLVTVMVENVLLNKDTGYPEKQQFVLYSAPTTLPMAQSIAASLKRVNKSYRIAEQDGKGKVIDEWLRLGFFPSDKIRLRRVKLC